MDLFLQSWLGGNRQLRGLLSGNQRRNPIASARSTAVGGDSWPFRSIGAPDDVVKPSGITCQEISRLLGQVGVNPGEFSFGGEASMLPSLPGLTVNNGSDTSLSLRTENANLVVKEARKIKENLWMLTSKQVKMKNPEWDKRIQQLCKLSTERLGFTGIQLKPVLSMVVIYGAGGRLDKQQALDRTGKSVVAIEVQLPSFYTGGNLVVEQEEINKQFRYTLGNDDGTALFIPHYAVYTAGAYRTVEEVTSGYRLGLIYALYLPSELQSVTGRRYSDMLAAQLAEAMKGLGGNCAIKGEGQQPIVQIASERDKSCMFALMLSKSCSVEDISIIGTEMLKDLDTSRYQALLNANSLLPPEKKVRFYIAHLWYSYDNKRGRKEIAQRVSWYTTKSEILNQSISIEWPNNLIS